MNLLRGDYNRLTKSVDIITGRGGYMPRCKPFKYTYEKEIVMYARFKKLVYFSTECIYSPQAFRGYVRELIKNLESQRTTSIIDIIHSAEKFVLEEKNITTKPLIKMKCKYCGFMSSNEMCKACALLEKLSKMKSKTKIEYDKEKGSESLNNVEDKKEDEKVNEKDKEKDKKIEVDKEK